MKTGMKMWKFSLEREPRSRVKYFETKNPRAMTTKMGRMTLKAMLARNKRNPGKIFPDDNGPILPDGSNPTGNIYVQILHPPGLYFVSKMTLTDNFLPESDFHGPHRPLGMAC